MNKGKKTIEQTPGHGLGLAIVRRIVSSYGGQLVLRNCQPGLGVSLKIPLPGLPTDSAE